MTPEKIAEMEKEADRLIAEARGETVDATTSPSFESGEQQQAADGIAADGLTGDLPADDAAGRTSPEPDSTEQAPEMVPMDRYKNAEKRMQQATHEAADLRRQLAEMASQLEAVQAQASTQGQQSTPQQPEPAQLQPSEAWGSFAEEWPEIQAPVEARIAAAERALQSQFGEYRALMEQVKAEEARRATDAHNAEILSAHPDASTIASSPEWTDWLSTQGPWVQGIAKQGGARDVVFILDAFKQQRGDAPRAAQPSPRGKTIEDARRVATPNVGRVGSGINQQRITTEQLRELQKGSWKDIVRSEAAIDNALSQGMIG